MKKLQAPIAGFLIGMIMLTVTLSACGQPQASASKDGGAITIVPSPYGQFDRNFNPFLAQNNTSRSGTAGLIYESLLYINRLNGQVQPWLAQRYFWSQDAKTLTFTLRSGVKWTDGYPLTSADVVYTLQVLLQNPGNDPGHIGPVISRIDAPDGVTVVITFIAPSPGALWYIGGQTFIVPQHIWKTFADPGRATNPNPIGTGPFVLQSFAPSLYTLTKNPHYWQPGKPSISEVRFPAYSSNTGTGLLLAQGNIDWTGVYAPDIQQVFVGLDPAHNHYWFPPISLVMLYLNLTKAPFDQLPVRQAISLAINRDVLSQQTESGYEPPALPSAVVLPGFANFLAPQYAQSRFGVDDAKAMSLLEQAGYHKNAAGTAVDASGHALSFSLYSVSGWNDWETMAKSIAKDLAGIGITVQVQTLDYADYLTRLQTGAFDTAISWTASGPNPYFLYNGLLNSTNSAPLGQNALSNWERWNDSTSDALLAKYAASTDAAAQKAALASLEEVMVERVPAIPLTDAVSWYEYSTARFVGWPTANDPYTAPSPYASPDIEIVLLHLHQA